MSPHELAQRFVEKAAQDATVVEKLLLDLDIADEVIGFHCQQAAEKLLKAILVARGVEFRRTHDLVELVDVLDDNHVIVPGEIADLETLNPFAVELRYDLFPSGAIGAFDRVFARDIVAKLRIWAESVLATGPESTDSAHRVPQDESQ